VNSIDTGQARLDFEADDEEWVMIGGFREPRYRTTRAIEAKAILIMD